MASQPPHKQRFKLIPAVYLVLKKENKVMLQLRSNTGYADGSYGLVSGHLDGDESATAAMCREAAEEIGIVIKPTNLNFSHLMHRKSEPDNERMDMFFNCTQWDNEPLNREPHKHGEIRWFPTASLPPNILDYTKEALRCIDEGIQFSEYGWSK